jgi:hypothetical protein
LLPDFEVDVIIAMRLCIGHALGGFSGLKDLRIARVKLDAMLDVQINFCLNENLKKVC